MATLGRGDVVNGEPAGSALLSKILAWLVLALMLVATAYTGWVALANFHRIGV